MRMVKDCSGHFSPVKIHPKLAQMYTHQDIFLFFPLTHFGKWDADAATAVRVSVCLVARSGVCELEIATRNIVSRIFMVTCMTVNKISVASCFSKFKICVSLCPSSCLRSRCKLNFGDRKFFIFPFVQRWSGEAFLLSPSLVLHYLLGNDWFISDVGFDFDKLFGYFVSCSLRQNS